MRDITSKANRRPTILKGITPDQIKMLAQNKGIEIEPKKMKVINSRNKTVIRKVDGVKKQIEMTPRPDSKYLMNLATDVVRIETPERGSFNPGLVKVPNSTDFIMVYRPDEHNFIGCILDSNFNVYVESYFKFNIKNCADPRIIWTNEGKLLLVYSSTTGTGLNYECIRGAIIMDLNNGLNFIQPTLFRISPESLVTRQKNWMPFIHEGSLFLIASVLPHIIYKFDLNTFKCEKVSEEKWISSWIYPNQFLRGNTNPVMLKDGNYLGTFHTAVWNNKKCYYDNGCYVFEGKYPFKVLKCSNRTYLPAEGAIEPHFRNARTIVCTFPVGMVRDENKIYISYGDNDSIIKIMKTTVDKMLSLTLDIY